MELIDPLLKLVGQFAVFGILILALVRHFGERWIENKFERERAVYKHQHELDVQKLRVEIDSALNANLKLQEREFESLSTAWSLLQETYSQIAAYVSPRASWPDVNNLDSGALDELLANSGFPISHQEFIRKAGNKLEAYKRATFIAQSKLVEQSYSRYRDYILQFGIFFTDPIRQKFRLIDDKFRSSIVGKQLGRDAKDWKLQGEAYTQLTKETKSLCDALESEINLQLRQRGSLI
jgi:hypothetical protein